MAAMLVYWRVAIFLDLHTLSRSLVLKKRRTSRRLLGCPRKLVKGQEVGYNPNLSHLYVGYNPLILTIDPNFLSGTSKFFFGILRHTKPLFCCGWMYREGKPETSSRPLDLNNGFPENDVGRSGSTISTNRYMI